LDAADPDERPDDVINVNAPPAFKGEGTFELVVNLAAVDAGRVGTNDVRAVDVVLVEPHLFGDKEVARARLDASALANRQGTVAVAGLKAGDYAVRLEARGLADASLNSATRKFSLAAAASAGIQAAVTSPASGKPAITFTDAPALYVQAGSTDGMVVRWASPQAVKASLALLDADGHALQTYTGEAGTGHRFAIGGLKAGTAYKYTALEAGVEVGHGTFRTNNPPEQQRFRFIAVGDTGQGTSQQYAVAHQMALWKPDFAVLPGDIIYPAGSASDYGPHYVAPYRPLIDHLCFWPALGNHDMLTKSGQPFLDFFDVPGRYYTFRYGQAQFFMLDSNQDPAYTQPQTKWLTQQLQASQSAWKFAVFHHPPYSSGEHGSSQAIRDAWGPLFEKYNVQLVFTGHDHDYERTTPREDYVKDGKPTTYVVVGGGGATTRPVKKSDFTAVAKASYHFLGVTVDGDRLVGDALDDTGASIDSFSITR
ncbi:MAG: metallophosphoesterase/PKD domain protein, partial [Cyanobacteria bacterium RYN_339]|nr:metallophosphoesterase/PKD domain protein [Cyanobacteria bacterium RYN_339]